MRRKSLDRKNILYEVFAAMLVLMLFLGKVCDNYDVHYLDIKDAIETAAIWPLAQQ